MSKHTEGGASSLGVAFFVNGLYLLIDEGSVELSGGNVTVTHQLLEGTDVRAVFQQVHGEAVPEGMGGNVLFDSRRM